MDGNREELAYDKIKTAISKGYITKGSQLKEISLAESLNMSRATVKGAFKRLVYEGLAEYKLNRGVFVINPSLELVQQSFQVRAQLEKMATVLAAGKLAVKDINMLQRLIQKEENVFKARKLDRYYEINNAFHLSIAQKSGNQVLIHYIKELLQKTTVYLILLDPFYQILDENNLSPREHKKIVRYLQKNDGKRAGVQMQNHLESSMQGIDLERLLPADYLTV
jgi:DNA-binding GntR family transcriptional regulator